MTNPPTQPDINQLLTKLEQMQQHIQELEKRIEFFEKQPGDYMGTVDKLGRPLLPIQSGIDF